MKKKFKMMMFYFKSAGLKEIPFEFEASDSNYTGSVILDTQLKVTGVIEDIVQDIVNIYSEKCVDEALSNIDYDNISDYYTIYGVIDTIKETIIFENLDYTYYGSETTGMYYEKDDYVEDDSMYNTFVKVDKILTELNIDKMIVGYSGGGDSGYIDGDYRTEDGQSGGTPAGIEDICYDLLQEYGGWEINEGSQGNITFTKDFIEIEHEWNTQENDSTSIDIQVNADSFSE